MTSSIKEMKRVFEKIWIPFGNISNSETLCNSMSSWEKIKWLFQILRKRVGSFKESFWKSLEVFWNPIFHLKLFEFPNFKSSKNIQNERRNMTLQNSEAFEIYLAKEKQKRFESGLKFKFKPNYELIGFYSNYFFS